MGRWNEDRVVFTMKVLNDMAKDELKIVVNNVDLPRANFCNDTRGFESSCWAQ